MSHAPQRRMYSSSLLHVYIAMHRAGPLRIEVSIRRGAPRFGRCFHGGIWGYTEILSY